MGVSLTVDVGQCRYDLTEEHTGLLLRQTVFRDDVIEQLSSGTILKERGKTNKQKKHRYSRYKKIYFTATACMRNIPRSGTILLRHMFVS